MNLRSALTAGGVGLAATGLACTTVLTGATGASAATTAVSSTAAKPLATTYLCSNDIIRDQEIPTTFDVQLPKKVKSGRTVDPIPFTVQVTVPDDVRNLLTLLGITEVSGTSTGAKVSVGPQKVKVGKVTIPTTDVPAAGDLTLDGSGKSKAFKAGKPGRYAVLAPASFVADLRDQDDMTLPGGALTCGLQDGAPDRLGSVRVVR